jgi:hypothetical protein
MHPLSGVVAVLGGTLLFMAVRWWRDPVKTVRRGLSKVPRKALRATQDGEHAHVAGTARGPATLTSPLTGRTCIGYRYVVEFYDEDWIVVAQGRDCLPFRLTEDGIESAVEGPFVFGLDPVLVDRAAQPGLQAVLRHPEDKARAKRGGDKVRAREALLVEGGKVSVLGQVSVEVHPQGERESFRDPPTRRIIRGLLTRPVLLGDVTPG